MVVEYGRTIRITSVRRLCGWRVKVGRRGLPVGNDCRASTGVASRGSVDQDWSFGK